MNRTKIVLSLVVATVLLFSGVFFYGRHLGKSAGRLENLPPTVNSQTILDRITSKYFLVTKTVFSNSNAEIETPKNNNWTDLFVGKKITVRGLIRTDVGVDMNKLNLENIITDPQSKTVAISLPHAEILNSSLFGKIDVDVDKSILEKIKGLLNDTRNEDYNLALQTLINSAKNQVTANENIFTEARNDSIRLVELIVKSMLSEYQVVVK